MIGEVVGLVCVTGSPMYNELKIMDQVTNPVRMRVNVFESTLLYSVISDAILTIHCWFRL
jgi:hypothetical protein